MAKKGVITGKEVLDGVDKAFADANAQLEILIGNYAELVALVKSLKTLSDANGIGPKTNGPENKINELIKERNRLLKEEQRLKAKNQALSEGSANGVIKERIESQRLNKEKKEELQLESKLTTELRKAQIIRNGLAKIIQDLNVKKSLGNKLTKEESKLLKDSSSEFKRYDKAVRGAEESVGRFQGSVGNYKKALGGIASVTRTFVAAFGVYSGLQVVKAIFDQVKQIEALDLALSKVTDSQLEFNQTQIFLQDVAKFTGVSIIDLTDAYKSFRGALKGANITVQEGQEVFSQVTKASAILGSSTDETNGVLRAFGQIISKGKVQAEELRGQLGDRLSGAFGLMAKAIGVTTEQLDKMIEQGEVTSDTVIELARVLGEEFGADSVESIETINASLGRLQTAWTNFLRSVEDGKGVLSKFFKSGIEGLTNFLEGLKEINTTPRDAGIEAAKTLIVDFRNTAEATQTEIKTFIVKTTQEAEKNIDILRGRVEALSSNTNKLFNPFNDEKLKEAQDALEKEIATRDELTQQLNVEQERREDLAEEALKLSSQLAEQEGNKLNLKNQEIFINNLTTLSIEEMIRVTKQQIKVNNEELEQSKKKGKAKKEEKIILEGSVDALTKYIKEQEDLRDRTAQTTEAYNSYNKGIDEAKKKIEDLIGAIKILNDTPDILSSSFGADTLDRTDQGLLADDFAQKGRDAADAARKEEILKEKQKLQAIKALKQGFIDDVNDLDKKQTENLEAALKQRLDLEKESQEAKKEIVFSSIDGIFQKRVEDVERELELNQERLDAVLNSENASDEQKEIARRKAASDEIKLEKEKRKREKEAFLVRQGLAIAEIAINLARTISAINLAGANLAAAFPVGGVALQAAYVATNIPLAIGSAALQTGAVIAQSIPAFFKGKNAMDSYEGLATWGEHRPEVLVREDGSMEVSPNKTTPLYVKKNDIIVPSISQFHREVKNPDSDVFKRVSQKINSDTSERKNMIVVNNNTMDTRGIEEVLEKVMYKYSKRPNVIQNTIRMPEQRINRY